MIPLSDFRRRDTIPVVTTTLVLLNVIIYLWDRHGHIFGPSVAFADLAMRPSEVLRAIHDSTSHKAGADLFPIVTLFTSLFLHGGLMHIFGNMLFLSVFGATVEDGIGSVRFAIYYLAWGLMASAAQIYVDPGSVAPTIGASGAIGGVLGCYLILFPSNKIRVALWPLIFIEFSISAWIMLSVWFAWQLFIPQNRVANWAHIGGFLAGMVTVLVMGGRQTALTGHKKNAEFT